MTTKRSAYMDAAEAEIDRLQLENERLKEQIREGNARFEATVEAVVADRWAEWQRWRAADMEHCPGCGEVSAKTLLCRACTLAEVEADRQAVSAVMTTKLEPYEVLFEIKDGIEYATVHADAFRDAMRVRDELQAEVGRLHRALVDVQFDLLNCSWQDQCGHLKDAKKIVREAL